MSKISRRLPLGGRTTDVDEYVDAWKGLAKPMETILGWRLCAMDPGYTFEDRYGQRVELTVSQVQEMTDKLMQTRWRLRHE